MSYYLPETYRRGWTSVEDIEKSLVNASRIAQDTEGVRRSCVPPMAPLKDLTAEPLRAFNPRNRPLNVMGRGQMIIEKEMACGVVLQDQRISRELSLGIPGMMEYCDSTAQDILTSCVSAQFVDCDESHPDEPSFDFLKDTSTPSKTKEPAESPETLTKPNLLVEHDSPDVPEGTSFDDSSRNLDDSTSLPVTSDCQEPSVDSQIPYTNPLYYTFDESVYIKLDPIIPLTGEAPTPSPCSSPLPDRSAIDGHFVGCIQMESDSSSSPSPIFDPNLADLMANNNASDFTTRLQKTLPDDYQDVMSVWKDFQSGQISYSALELQIARLLGPYPDLMDAFFKFTSLSPSDENQSLIEESLNGENPEVLELSDPSSNGVVQPLDDTPCKAAPRNGSSIVKNESSLFEEYIKFCRIVKDKFAERPEVFSEFLALLNDYQESKYCGKRHHSLLHKNVHGRYEKHHRLDERIAGQYNNSRRLEEPATPRLHHLCTLLELILTVVPL